MTRFFGYGRVASSGEVWCQILPETIEDYFDLGLGSDQIGKTQTIYKQIFKGWPYKLEQFLGLSLETERRGVIR